MSIHSLSHSWATNRFLSASGYESGLDVNSFDALSAEAGHGDASMTLTYYVHRFEEAIRGKIDTEIASRLRWPEMAPFVSVNHDTYRQRLSRQKRSMVGLDDGQCKLQLVRAALPFFKFPAADCGIETAEAKTTAIGAPTKGIPLGMVIDVLTDIGQGTSVEITALRACRSQEVIVRIIHLAMEILVELDEFRPGRQKQGLSDVADDLRIALHAATRGRIDFSKIRQPKLLALREFLARGLSEPTVHDAIQSWLQCYRYGYVSLAQPSCAAALVRMLKASGISASAIGIFCIPSSDPASLRLKAEIEAVFVQEYAATPLTKTCSIRGGRPSAYLAISGTDFTDRASSATLCMKGLNALMFSVCVLERVGSGYEDEKQ